MLQSTEFPQIRYERTGETERNFETDGISFADWHYVNETCHGCDVAPDWICQLGEPTERANIAIVIRRNRDRDDKRMGREGKWRRGEERREERGEERRERREERFGSKSYPW